MGKDLNKKLLSEVALAAHMDPLSQISKAFEDMRSTEQLLSAQFLQATSETAPSALMQEMEKAVSATKQVNELFFSQAARAALADPLEGFSQALRELSLADLEAQGVLSKATSLGELAGVESMWRREMERASEIGLDFVREYRTLGELTKAFISPGIVSGLDTSNLSYLDGLQGLLKSPGATDIAALAHATLGNLRSPLAEIAENDLRSQMAGAASIHAAVNILDELASNTRQATEALLGSFATAGLLRPQEWMSQHVRDSVFSLDLATRALSAINSPTAKTAEVLVGLDVVRPSVPRDLFSRIGEKLHDLALWLRERHPELTSAPRRAGEGAAQPLGARIGLVIGVVSLVLQIGFHIEDSAKNEEARHQELEAIQALRSDIVDYERQIFELLERFVTAEQAARRKSQKDAAKPLRKNRVRKNKHRESKRAHPAKKKGDDN